RRILIFFFFQAEDGIRDRNVTGVQTCALPIWPHLPDRDAGRSEHRPHRVARDLWPREPVRVHRVAVPPGRARRQGPLLRDRRDRSQERRVGQEWRWGGWE